LRVADEATPTRDALWYCDAVTGPTGIRVSFVARIAEIQQRYGPGDLVSHFIRAAQSELSAAVERTTDRMAAAGIAPPVSSVSGIA
jgi:hypothetical protein